MNYKLVPEPLVIEINRRICLEGENPCGVLKTGGVASALHSAYYPGNFPFVHGSHAGIAAALSFYLTQSHIFQDGNKRTAAQVSLFFLKINGYDVKYSLQPNALADNIESCAKGELGIAELTTFYENCICSF